MKMIANPNPSFSSYWDISFPVIVKSVSWDQSARQRNGITQIQGFYILGVWPAEKYSFVNIKQ